MTRETLDLLNNLNSSMTNVRATYSYLGNLYNHIVKTCDHQFPNGTSAVTDDYGGEYCTICDKRMEDKLR